ncbi:MAG: hypothetical protein VYB44_07185 [Bacteroidota bacterium]|nr:hypothetical protein [Bacteroidota bacterium]
MGPLDLNVATKSKSPLSALFEGVSVSAIPGAIGMVAQLFGRKRRKQQEDAAMKNVQEVSDMFKGQISDIDTQLNQSYLENSDIKDALRQLEEMGFIQNSQTANQAAITGATDESQIAAMGKTKSAQADFLAKLMSGATDYRNMLFGQKGSAVRGLGATAGAQYQAGMQNRANFNKSIENIIQPLQSSINAGFESGAFKFGK